MSKTAQLQRGAAIAHLLSPGTSRLAVKEDMRLELLDGALAPLKETLQAVTDRVLQQLGDPVARNVVYLITAGGKRLRPALVLLSGGADESTASAALLDTAAAVELIHTATLIHDDIIDQSPLRRAQPTYHHRWGTERAVLMGDYLYATAFALLARLQSPSVMPLMSDVCRQLCRGELREVEARYRLDLTEAEYLEIIRDKTASLISACCESGALLAGASPPMIAQLREFGLQFGLAFQIIDDCLDLTGDAAELGKTTLADLDKGALSLPLIYLARSLPVGQRRRLFAPLTRRANDPAFLRRIATAAIARGAVAQAQARALAYARAAQRALQTLPTAGLADACRRLADYVVLRRS
ncbi:MAG: polyprenyl synthetase family protein [Candidatus Omnitrophica bacterium]|nr:polyprenyl synthetase family protein [Candidatus Omnitrophota bacterium]